MGAVKQHNLHQLRRQPSGQNPAAETLTDQQRKASGMIDMRVSHQHIINHPGLKRQRPVVDLITALLQPAVNQDLFSGDLQAVAASGNTAVGAIKAQFHHWTSSTDKIRVFFVQIIPYFPCLYKSFSPFCHIPLQNKSAAGCQL